MVTSVTERPFRMGLEGIVSKRTDAPYRSGPSKTWVKSKNPASEAMRREHAEEADDLGCCAPATVSHDAAARTTQNAERLSPFSCSPPKYAS